MVRFIPKRQTLLRMKYLKTPHRFLKHLIVLPFIYPAVIPFLLLDFWIELYHRVSFPIYGIPTVKRSRYVLIDRHRLQYLNIMQKLNCIYCGYASGILQYRGKNHWRNGKILVRDTTREKGRICDPGASQGIHSLWR